MSQIAALERPYQTNLYYSLLETLASGLRSDPATLSLPDYVAQAWRVVEPATRFVPNWHIDAICEHLAAITAGEIRNLIINVPPRTMKSLLVSVMWPTWV